MNRRISLFRGRALEVKVASGPINYRIEDRREGCHRSARPSGTAIHRNAVGRQDSTVPMHYLSFPCGCSTSLPLLDPAVFSLFSSIERSLPSIHANRLSDMQLVKALLL